jgi:pilus assembly protein CpaB
MRISNITMLVAALVCATIAALLSRAWLAGQSGGERALVATDRTAPTRSIVVAARELKYGEKLTPDMVRLVPWSSDNLPKGAILTIDRLSQDNQERIVLAAMAENEPVLEQKITGDASGLLAAKLAASMNAVTIRVNDVAGVAGFVQPEDRVDVFLTIGSKPSEDVRQQTKPSVVVLLKNIRVLATDQGTQRNNKASPPKSVTLEVNTEDAQKLVLSASIGQLSLALRRGEVMGEEDTRTIAIEDLVARGADAAPPSPGGPIVGVTRGIERTEHTVKPDEVKKVKADDSKKPAQPNQQTHTIKKAPPAKPAPTSQRAEDNRDIGAVKKEQTSQSWLPELMAR